MSFQDKVIIVTGACSGIGLALSQHLLDNGARVFGVDIQPLPEGVLLSQNFALQQCDLTEPNTAEQVVQATQSKFGKSFHGLANVAGIMDKGASVDTLAESDWDRVMAVNVTAPVRLMSAVVKVWKAEGAPGAIVNVSSKAGTSGASAGISYTASKHALIGATKNVAWRFAEEGIRCNAIAPGSVMTNIGKTASNDMSTWDKEGMARSYPVTVLNHGEDYSKVMAPEDLAPAIAFLLSDGSKMISGAVLPIDRATVEYYLIDQGLKSKQLSEILVPFGSSLWGTRSFGMFE